MKNMPRLNASYWILMLLCTTMGELIGNLISRNFEVGYTKGTVLDILIFSVTIFIFLSFRLKNEIFYWVLILMGNIAGTNLADWVTLEPLASDENWGLLKPLQLGTEKGSIAVMSALLLVLITRNIVARKFNFGANMLLFFYWIAILLSSTFGTTSGDYITNDTPLGALGGSIALIAILMLTLSTYRMGFLSQAAAYWSALLLIHPVGATLGNYVSKPIGLNLGNIYTNIALVLLFIGLYFADGRAKLH